MTAGCAKSILIRSGSTTGVMVRDDRVRTVSPKTVSRVCPKGGSRCCDERWDVPSPLVTATTADTGQRPLPKARS